MQQPLHEIFTTLNTSNGKDEKSWDLSSRLPGLIYDLPQATVLMIHNGEATWFPLAKGLGVRLGQARRAAGKGPRLRDLSRLSVTLQKRAQVISPPFPPFGNVSENKKSIEEKDAAIFFSCSCAY